MNTIAYGAPRLSRAKALIGALLATLAIGAMQAASPDSASAMKARCAIFMEEGHRAESEGRQVLADFYYDSYWVCMRG
jgi:hypothetical protein